MVAKKQTTPAETTETTTPAETPKAPQFKRKAQLTFPVLKKQDDTPIFVRIEGAIFTGRDIQTKKGEEMEKPAQIARVTNLETGEQMEMICNKVLESTLNEQMPDDGYVGKCFEIIQRVGKKGAGGRAYKTYSVWEIDCPNG